MARCASRKEVAARTGELPEVVRYLRMPRRETAVLRSEELHSPELQITVIDRETRPPVPRWLAAG